MTGKVDESIELSAIQQSGHQDIFAEPESSSNWTDDIRNQILTFCGIDDVEDEEAEKWQKWQSRRRMLASRSSSKRRSRQPEAASMMLGDSLGDSRENAAYHKDEVDGLGRKKVHLYSQDEITMMRPGRRTCRPGPISKTDKVPLYEVTYNSIKQSLTKPKLSERRRRVKSRSFAPADVCKRNLPTGQALGASDDGDYVDYIGTRPSRKQGKPHVLDDNFFDRKVVYDNRNQEAHGSQNFKMMPSDEVPLVLSADDIQPGFDETDNMFMWEAPRSGGWQWRERQHRFSPPGTAREIRQEDIPFQGLSRISQPVKQTLMGRIDNADRWDASKSTCLSLITDGVFAKVFDFRWDRYYKYAYDNETGGIKADRSSDHRSGFTMWLTFVQLVICIVSVSIYGFAPFGVALSEISEEILQPTLALEKLSYLEPSSFWLGPRQADLIHLGAKYSPCMRQDDNIQTALKFDRNRERETACCIYNDGSGCMQTLRSECSKVLSTFDKWSKAEQGPDNYTSGSVCGQDPRFCKNPVSHGAFKWPDDITEWPICKDQVKPADPGAERHLSCDLTGRPCCYGIQGECMITTRQHCEFLRGFFHEEATLCSQVSCLNEICGMLPFGKPDVPDQFYRLFTSLFLHAGLLHLFVTIIYNLFVLRPVEVMIGWIRLVVIFFGSGIAGSLASAIFLPYLVVVRILIITLV